MRRVLYRAQYFVADSRHAKRETGGGVLRPVAGGFPVRAFRATGATGGLRQLAPVGGDVREHPAARSGLFGQAGTGHRITTFLNGQKPVLPAGRRGFLGEITRDDSEVIDRFLDSSFLDLESPIEQQKAQRNVSGFIRHGKNGFLNSGHSHSRH